ncbi:MAG: choice-of-anchor tandem repeat GloVer-containing protein [Candidatus Korobacteraceae bacterium]
MKTATKSTDDRVKSRTGMRITVMSLCATLALAVAIQSAQAQTYQVIHNFTGADGELPDSLTIGRGGSLYGTTYLGGQANAGTVYKLTPKNSAWVFSSLYSFSGVADGANPNATVTIGPDGDLYGTTVGGGDSNGDGTVFKLTPPATACKTALCPWTETVLHRFSGNPDGRWPYAAVAFDNAGNLYSTTFSGGSGGSGNNNGIVFKLTPSGGGWTESILYSFQAAGDGANPAAEVIFDNAGNLYSTAELWGPGSNGTVFRLTPSGGGWTEDTLYPFQGGNDGGYPYAGLISDQSGNLYGATTCDGSGAGGTAFQLTPSGGSWTFSLLHSFTWNGTCTYGPGPWYSLTMDQAGNLYGTTYEGGANGVGTVFKLAPSGGGWTYTDLYDFTPVSGGNSPYSNVVIDSQGNLYGTAAVGGTGSCGSNGWCGVVWEITP